MADMGLSLDDIIRKAKPLNMKGRKSREVLSNKGGVQGRGAFLNRSPRPNGSIQGRGRGTTPSGRITDARFKIIQKNRRKLIDARDKLAEIAKQSDARLKLEKLRANHHIKSIDPFIGISRRRGRNGRISLSTNKSVHLLNPNDHSVPNSYVSPSTRTIGFRPPLEPNYSSNMPMNFDDDYSMDSPPLRRTVNNEYAPSIPLPPLPVFDLKPASPYTWVKPPSSSLGRSVSTHKPERERLRDFKVVAHNPMAKRDSSSYREDWAIGSKSRTILPNSTSVDVEYYDSRNQRDSGLKSRLDSAAAATVAVAAPPKPRNMSVATPKSNIITGYRIVVSNLQANVTQEDIKELFEDVGELLVSRLVRPGTAEVIYKTLKDATKAVETYHNRQLDGHPMKCLLVNPRPKNNPTAPAVRTLTEPRSRTGSNYVQPSLGAVHRALFDD